MGLLDIIIDAVEDLYWTDERLGKHGEDLTEKKLNLINLFGRKGKTLRNIYIPKDNGETSEIDLVYITQKGIFVLESKNYSGWIFGDAVSQYWTSCLPNGERNRFYNPVKQNRTHIKWLSSYLSGASLTVPLFSVIVFSERCELKKVPEDSDDVMICNRDMLYWKIRSKWDKLLDTVSDADSEKVYQLLSRLTIVSEAQKQAHIDSITKKKMNASENLVCPRCGSSLVLRTAHSGNNAGKQFYGCSGFPKCRYTKNI